MINRHIKNTFNDFETQRDQRKATLNQQNKILATKEGVVINSIVKDSVNNNINDLTGNYIIPENESLPQDLFQNDKELAKNQNKSIGKNIISNPFTPLCLTTIGILGGAAIVSKVLHKSAKMQTTLANWEKLQDLPRNMNLMSEQHFVTYNAVQNPNIKTVLGAFALFAFSGATFVMKNFIDGFKDIWVKKQDANIERNLQENLIAVETRSFAGKNQIIRTLMKEKSQDFKKTIDNLYSKNHQIPSVFKGFSQKVSFEGDNIPKQTAKNKKNTELKYILIGAAALGASILLTKNIVKNIRKTANEFKNYVDGMNNQFAKMLENSPKDIMEKYKDDIPKIITNLNLEPKFAKEQLEKVNLPEEEVNNIINIVKERSKRFVPPPEAFGGRKGIQYYSYIDEVSGHFYNWVMNMDDKKAGKITKNLFIALTSVTGIGYLGKTSVEAIKDVQVKKYNAQTELDLHKRLVNVELKNFLSKKNSAINPLCEEFKRKAVINQKPKELYKMADEILYEIKNGAPFVYS